MHRNRRPQILVVALALLIGACSGGGSDEVAPSTTAAVAPTTTAPGPAAVPLDELRLSTERRVAIGSGDDAVLLVDGSHPSAGDQIAAWLIDRDDPTVALPVVLPVDGRHGPTWVVPWGGGFLVVTWRCPSDALDEPRGVEPGAVDAPCGTFAHDVFVVPGDGGDARALLVGEVPDGELARQMMIGALTPTAAFLHWADETGGHLASIDGDVAVVEPLGRAVARFCSVGDEVYALGESRFVGGRAEAPRPIGEFVDLARLEDGAWVPVAVPAGPPEHLASPTGCGDGRVVFATLDEDLTGVRALDLRAATPTWTALPVPEHDGGSGRVVVDGTRDRLRLLIGGSPPTYVWDEATASWVVDESFCCGLVDNGLIELVPHPSGTGLAVQLVPGS